MGPAKQRKPENGALQPEVPRKFPFEPGKIIEDK